MRGFKYFGLLAIILLVFTSMHPIVLAESERTLQDESIYELLVDRFFNGDLRNDEEVNTQIPHAFYGGDFAGVQTKLQYLKELGFTMISIGPVFRTELYDGSRLLDYREIEPRYGSGEQFNKMLDALHEENLKVITDFPLSGISEQHVWVQNNEVGYTSREDGTVEWNAADLSVQNALKDAILDWVEAYPTDGIRLTRHEQFDNAFLNEIIAAIKTVKPSFYVFSDTESDANFDNFSNARKMQVLIDTFTTIDQDASKLSVFEDNVETDFIRLDTLTSQRFTYDMVQAKMFPPTRWKIATTALFTLPGVPVLTYGSEIAVNGQAPPESHPLSNFNTDMELYDFISDLNILRNKSETLRNGDFEILHNEDGFVVYKRSSEKETWIIALNNQHKTASFTMDEDAIGGQKRLRGLLESDMIRQSDDGKYRIVLDREVAEIYYIDEDKGFNTPFLISSIFVYILFLGFMYIVWRNGRKHRNNKNSVTK